ncbi:MAG TPA: non-ribosomal peptide synthetase, partial [Candidatus Deferrimicrobium sp.]|nr:non-ribosomal peptide synthetase [Candidatus Deferrimicrobium sp.]
VIYTSGSTGRPKGVMIDHRSLANLCGWHNRQFAITPFDRATKYAGLGFDASVWEIFPYIIAGAGIYIIADEIRLEVEKLKNCFDVHGITISFLPTQVCEQFMLNVSSPGSLRFLLTGGDKLQRFAKRNYRLINNYGPTENTVVTTSGEIDENSYRTGIPIGKPISNNQVYILDKRNRLQPMGAAGELCIGGESLAAGYLNNPELTAEKFYRSYRSYRSYIFYKTGDLVKWLPDGNIRFLGRVDTQVKIRGYRIEPGEVENLLLARDDMGAAVVIISGVDDRYLCAYYVVSKSVTGPVDAGELKEYLAGKLPGYMIPRYFVPIEQIPLTSNGKVDRKMLPDPGKDENGTARQGYVAPSNEIEEKLSRLWQEVLGIRQPGINDNFFDLGGDSIKAIQVTARLRPYGLELKISDLFLNPTIKGSALNVKEIEPVDRQENDEIQVYAGISSAILDEFEDEFRDID